MDGITAVWGVLSAHAGLLALVPAARILSDDVLTLGIAVPSIQLELISGVDRNPLGLGATVHVRQRVRIRIHAKDAGQRAAIRAQVRAALFADRFPTVSGLSNVRIDSDGEGPDGLSLHSNVRVGLIDAVVDYLEAR